MRVIVELSSILKSFENAVRYDKRRNKRLRNYYLNEAFIFLLRI